MNHSYFRDRLSAYLDNELTPEEYEVLRRHVGECRECQAVIADLENLSRVIEENSGLDGDEYFEKAAQKIERALGAAKQPRVKDAQPSSWRGLGWKVAAIAASLAVLTFIGLHREDILEGYESQREIQAPPEILSRGRKTQPKSKPPTQDEQVAEDVTSVIARGADKKVAEKMADSAQERTSEPAASRQPVRKEAILEESVLVAQPVAVPSEAADTNQWEKAQSVGHKDRGGRADEGQPEVEEESRPTRRVVSREKLPEEQYAGDMGDTVVILRAPDVVSAPSDFAELLADTVPSISTIELAGEPVLKAGSSGSQRDQKATVGQAVTPLDIDAYRVRRDSLEAVYSMLLVDEEGPHTDAKVAEESRFRSDRHSRPEVEREILDTYRYLGLYTDKEEERIECLRFLRSYLEREGALYPERARDILDEVESRRLEP